MESVKKTAEYEILKKRSGRYAVRSADRKWISGDEKVKILVDEKLIKTAAPKPAEPEPVEEEAPAEPEASEDAPAEGEGEE